MPLPDPSKKTGRRAKHPRGAIHLPLLGTCSLALPSAGDESCFHDGSAFINPPTDPKSKTREGRLAAPSRGAGTCPCRGFGARSPGGVWGGAPNEHHLVKIINRYGEQRFLDRGWVPGERGNRSSRPNESGATQRGRRSAVKRSFPLPPKPHPAQKSWISAM